MSEQNQYQGSFREAIDTCAYQLDQFVRAAVLTPGQKKRLMEIRSRLLEEAAQAEQRPLHREAAK